MSVPEAAIHEERWLGLFEQSAGFLKWTSASVMPPSSRWAAG